MRIASNRELARQLRVSETAIRKAEKGLIPTGELAKVAGGPMDFTSPTAIAARIRNDDQQLVPPASPSETASRARPSCLGGSPQLPASPFRRAVPINPGGPQRVHLSVASPPRAAFPEIQAGRRPRLLFRGLLRLHSRYGPPDRPTAQGGLCHEASTRLVAQAGRWSATRSTDNSLGGTFPATRAIWAH